MPESSARIVALQRRIARLSRPRVVVDAGTVPTGDPAIDGNDAPGVFAREFDCDSAMAEVVDRARRVVRVPGCRLRDDLGLAAVGSVL